MYVNSKRLGLLDPSIKLESFLRNFLAKELPDDIHELCNNKLFINLTHFISFKPMLVSEYLTKNDLIDVFCT